MTHKEGGLSLSALAGSLGQGEEEMEMSILGLNI